MEQITLIKRNGTRIKLFNKEPFRTVKTATQSKSLMGVDTVTLSILSRDILSFDKGIVLLSMVRTIISVQR